MTTRHTVFYVAYVFYVYPIRYGLLFVGFGYADDHLAKVVSEPLFLYFGCTATIYSRIAILDRKRRSKGI